MRILHVATLVTPDGAYGGPIRVALNQLAELQELGHTVQFAAAVSGFDVVPQQLQGVPARLFPSRRLVPRTGFAGLVAPGLTRFVRQHLSAYDVVHVHVARDLITLPVAAHVAKSSTALFLQPHGMIDRSSRPLAAVIDRVYTRRILRQSDKILALTPIEVTGLSAVAGPGLPLTTIANGVPVPDIQPVSEADSETGSPAENSRPEMLFLARLHPRKNAGMFVEAARALLDEGSEFNFTLVGPDEGDGKTVKRLISDHGLEGRVSWEGPLSPELTLARMSKAAAYILPSVGEVLSMSTLEAMSLGLPVVITESNGLAGAIRNADAGMITDGSLAGLIGAMRTLGGARSERTRQGKNAERLVADQFSISAVAKKLETLYAANLRRVDGSAS